jgi:RHS repeat-associated protein
MTPGAPPASYAYNYVYNYTDHLGNVRLSYSLDPQTQQLKILDESHYYPFGLKHSVYTPNTLKDFTIDDTSGGPGTPVLIKVLTTEYMYKYNGKEFQDELGLGLYDYGARLYDPALGRWSVIDPLAEMSRRTSPYVYALNNPIYFIDPDGMLAEGWYVDENSNIQYDENIKSQQYMDDNNIAGTFIDNSFFGEDQNGNIFHFNEDGSVSDLQVSREFLDPTGELGIEYVAITSTELGRKSDETVAEASTMAMTQGNGNPYAKAAALVGGTILLTEAIIEAKSSNDMQHSFSKVARGNHSDDGLRDWTDSEIASEIKRLSGNLSKEQKALKTRLQKEQKVRGQRNQQKKNSEKGTGTGRK